MPTDDLAAIKHLDFTEIRCQCEQFACRGKCPNPATLQVEFHALDHCNTQPTDPDINPFGNYTFLLCANCLKSLAASVAPEVAALNHFGPYTCGTCGAPARAVQPDLIREVKTL
jgi:hypothetical protein